MPISPLLAPLRGALQLLPVEWVLWSIDARGVLLTHEGPGIRLPGEDDGIGRSVWEVYRGDWSILAFATRVLREPAAAELVSGGLRFHIAGAPVPGGGAVGMALVLGESEAPCDPAELPDVIELLQPVPEIGADAGDLLLWNAERPEAMGVYREVATSRLPLELVRDLGLTRSSGAGSAPSGPERGGAARPLRERAAHLRVVS